MKSLCKMAMLLLGAGAFVMVLIAIWGEEPVKWGLTALITAACAVASGIAYDLLKDPPPKVIRDDRHHHLY